MKKLLLLKICFVLLLTTFSSVYAGDCFKDRDVDDCRVKAAQGHASAQYNLGQMYRTGDGVVQDDVMAHMFFNIAAVNGDKDAITNRGNAEKRMTPSQLEKAQDLAREWMRTHQ